MESRRSGASTPIPLIATQHEPFPSASPQRRSAGGRPGSSHLAASRQAAAKRPASAIGVSAQAKGTVSPLPQSQRHAWRPANTDAKSSIPSPLRRGLGSGLRRNPSFDEFDGDDSEGAMFGEREPTGIWSPLCGPGASRPSSALSSLHSPLSRPSSAIGSPLSRPSSALEQLGCPGSSIDSVLGRVDEKFYCDDALDTISDGRVWDLDDASNPTSPVHAGSRPSTAARTRESKLDGLGVSRRPIPSFASASAAPARPQTASQQTSIMQGSPISMLPSAHTGPRGLKSPFPSRPQTAQGLRSPFSQGMRSPFLSRPKTVHQNKQEVASPLLSVAGALAMPDEEGARTRSRPGTAIAQSSHAERLLHLRIDAEADAHVCRSSDSDWTQLVQVLSFIRKKAWQMSIRVIDFMTPFDKFRQGSITAGEFRRAMGLCLVFSELSDEELDAASFLFREQGDFSERIGEVHGPPRVQYLNFCVVIQPGESLGRSGRVVLTDDQKEMMRALNEETTESRSPIVIEEGHAQLPKSPLAVKPLAATGDAKMHSIMARILRRLRSTRGSIREFFADFDARMVKSDGGVRPTTANMNHSLGCVSRTQFERCMFNLCQLSERFEETELALLFWKYEKCGEFNYYRFVRDLEKAEAEADAQGGQRPNWPTAAPLGGAELGDIGVPEWGRGNGMSASTLEPVFTWTMVIREREGASCPDPVY